MTSSLVGSEMCIRDSPKDCPGKCFICGSTNHMSRDCTRPRTSEGVKPKPVSYTHLTLPTICSV
eukprot:11209737-Prorocentrum_lima.AAC.1